MKRLSSDTLEGWRDALDCPDEDRFPGDNGPGETDADIIALIDELLALRRQIAVTRAALRELLAEVGDCEIEKETLT